MVKNRRDSNIFERKIKKAERKVEGMKASTEQMKKELTQWANMADNLYHAIVQTREAVFPQILAAESLNAQLLELISALLAENDGD